jgi:hypothetical protein
VNQLQWFCIITFDVQSHAVNTKNIPYIDFLLSGERWKNHHRGGYSGMVHYMPAQKINCILTKVLQPQRISVTIGAQHQGPANKSAHIWSKSSRFIQEAWEPDTTIILASFKMQMNIIKIKHEINRTKQYNLHFNLHKSAIRLGCQESTVGDFDRLGLATMESLSSCPSLCSPWDVIPSWGNNITSLPGGFADRSFH